MRQTLLRLWAAQACLPGWHFESLHLELGGQPLLANRCGCVGCLVLSVVKGA